MSRLQYRSSHVTTARSATSYELYAQNAITKLCLPNISLVSVYGALQQLQIQLQVMNRYIAVFYCLLHRRQWRFD